MSKVNHFLSIEAKRKQRVRKKIFGRAVRPRLAVDRSNQHISLQVINDESGKTLMTASDMGKSAKYTGTKTERAIKVAQDLASKLKAEKITAIVFDRGAYRYHGRVKAVADALRESGIEV